MTCQCPNSCGNCRAEQPKTMSKEIRLQPEDISEELPCLLCGGPLYLKGCQDFREWFRCRNCGMDYGREIPRPPTQEIDP